MNDKKRLFLLVGGVAIIVFLVMFSARWLSQKNTTEKTSNVPTGFKEVEKEAIPDKIAEETKEVPADPEQVTVSAMQGTVVAVSKESITIKSAEKESVHKLAQERLGIFKKTGEDISIITVNDIKVGDSVNLEARQSDGVVNSIMVE